jgi:hypothetical protein
MFVTLKKIKIKYNLILFTLNFIFVFIIGLVPESEWITELYSIGVSGIFFASILSVTEKRIKYLYTAIVITILTWITTYLKMDSLEHLTSFASMVFFFYIVIVLVIQIAKSHQVGALEFLKAINIYFLFGIMGAIVFRTIYLADADAFRFADGGQFQATDFVYFSFVTMTTVGFGDITPISPLARNLSIFLSFGGQLYLTMIVALLVGKYLTKGEMGDPHHMYPTIPTIPTPAEKSPPGLRIDATEHNKESDPD